MGFDDLAKHMASRDGKKRADVPLDHDQFLADNAKAERRMNRTRDLVLGSVLLVGGLVIGALYAAYMLDAFDSTPDPNRPPENKVYIWTGGAVLVIGMLIVGTTRVIRGLRNRS